MSLPVITLTSEEIEKAKRNLRSHLLHHLRLISQLPLSELAAKLDQNRDKNLIALFHQADALVKASEQYEEEAGLKGHPFFV